MMTSSTSTRAIIFRILLILYISGVAFLCFANLSGLASHLHRNFLGIPMDKVVHFCMFFPFPILGFFSYDKLTKTPLQALGSAMQLLSFGCIFAGITEIIQGMMPYRSEDIYDFYADVAAICLSTMTVFAIVVLQSYNSYKKDKK